MRACTLVVLAFAAALGAAVSLAGSLRAAQPVPVALTGRVRSAAEGLMEGVVVTARRPGSPISVSVISDAAGRYRFPVSHLTPGTYGLRIRATGYDLSAPVRVMVKAASTATADLRLKTARDLEDQMSNGDWFNSVPGTDAQKTSMLDCTGCHTLQRVVDSYHTADDFRTNVLPRMGTYSFSSFWLKPQPFRNARAARINTGADLAAYLAGINQSSGPRKWALRPLPRLKGASTHVIITQYDLPDRLAQPHDVVGADGMIWYSDFGQQFLGRLNPKTGAVTEFPVKEFKPAYLDGSLDLEADPHGDLWLANLYQGGVNRFDPATQTFKQWAVPPAAHPDFTQASMVAPNHMTADGKVWTNNQDDHSFRRLDPQTGTWETFGPYYYPGSTTHTFNAYGIVTDPANTLWGFDFGGTAIGHLDPKTNAFKIIPTPTNISHPRRGRLDDRTGMLWFAEYGVNRIGSYDTKANDGTIKEYVLPTPFDSPYDVVPDKNGDVWAGSMNTDRITRLDSATGRMVDYQLPFTTNTRRVWVDNTTNPVTLWTGANHEAAIVELQTLP